MRADDVGLTTLAAPACAGRRRPVGGSSPGDGKGLHRLPSRRQLVDDGHIQIAVENQRQRPGDGGGGHAPACGGALRLAGQGRPLGRRRSGAARPSPPAPGRAYSTSPGEQGVGADGTSRCSRRPAAPRCDLLPLLGTGGAGEQGAGRIPSRSIRGDSALIVLPGQDLRRGHQGRLPAVLHAAKYTQAAATMVLPEPTSP